VAKPPRDTPIPETYVSALPLREGHYLKKRKHYSGIMHLKKRKGKLIKEKRIGKGNN
jgi:hypothetical protein